MKKIRKTTKMRKGAKLRRKIFELSIMGFSFAIALVSALGLRDIVRENMLETYAENHIQETKEGEIYTLKDGSFIEVVNNDNYSFTFSKFGDYDIVNMNKKELKDTIEALSKYDKKYDKIFIDEIKVSENGSYEIIFNNESKAYINEENKIYLFFAIELGSQALDLESTKEMLNVISIYLDTNNTGGY